MFPLPPNYIHADYAGAPPPLTTPPQPTLPNPHTYSTPQITRLRHKILTHFHTTSTTHSIIFGHSITHLFQSLLYRFPWEERDALWFGHRALHNSVLGTREFAQSWTLWENETAIWKNLKDWKDVGWNGLIVGLWSGECNLNGLRLGLTPGEAFQEAVDDHWSDAEERVVTVVDAGRLVCGNDINLMSHPEIDVMIFSFYKMFGLPTGLACMIVRNDSIVENLVRSTVRRRVFAGGTVDAVEPGGEFTPKMNLRDILEAGTINYVGIAQVEFMLNRVKALGGIDNLAKIGFVVAHACRNLLREIEGVKVYNCDNAIVVFSVWRKGVPLGWRRVVELLRAKGILVRGGCMCNPGACEQCLTGEWKGGNLSSCGESDVVDGQHTGVLRASFGYRSSLTDAEQIATAVRETVNEPIASWRVKTITIYPIKGTRGTSLTECSLDAFGLTDDRRWAICDEKTKKIVSTKEFPLLSTLRTKIGSNGNVLIKNVDQSVLHKQRGSNIDSHFTAEADSDENDLRIDFTEYCVIEWLPEFLKRKVRLVQGQLQNACSMTKSRAILAINAASLDFLAKESPVGDLEHRLRANIVFEVLDNGEKAFPEDGWQGVEFRSERGVVLRGAGRCRRCRTINVGPDGIMRKDRQPLETLEELRRGLGPDFGQLFDIVTVGNIAVGDVFHPV